MLEASVTQPSTEDEIAWACAHCSADGLPEPAASRISHGICGPHRDLVMIEGRIGIWNPARWPSNPPRVAAVVSEGRS